MVVNYWLMKILTAKVSEKGIVRPKQEKGYSVDGIRCISRYGAIIGWTFHDLM